MEYTTLGRSGMTVSRLAFGCEPLGGVDWGAVDAGAAEQAVRRAMELGINFFDTADVYGLGRSEVNLANALGEERKRVVIATKFGVSWDEAANGGRARTFLDSRPARVIAALEGSLRRLRLDCIPLYLLHWPDPRTPLEETLAALQECQRAGKVKHVGLCNCSVDAIKLASAIAPPMAVEMPYSLIRREAEDGLLRQCARLGVGTLAYGALGQGLLTGNYSAADRFDSSDRRSRLPDFQGGRLERNLSVVARIREVARESGKSPAQVAIRWLLDQDEVTCVIVGAKSPRQIEENVGSLGWRLTSGERVFLGEGVAGTPCHMGAR